MIGEHWGALDNNCIDQVKAIAGVAGITIPDLEDSHEHDGTTYYFQGPRKLCEWLEEEGE